MQYQTISENFSIGVTSEENFAEYHSAYRRFDPQFQSQDMNEEDLFLDALIQKFCVDSEIEVENEASLFFRILFRADFVQITPELKPIFYRKICLHFVLTNEIEKILDLIDDLDLIPHVKFDIFISLMKILNLQPKIENRCLTLHYFSSRICYEKFNFTKVDHIIISTSAYKVMLEKFDLNFFHLNFILRLLQIKKLTLNGCNLNWKDEGNILDSLTLKCLNMSYCGTSVNKIIMKNFENLKEHLKELDISGCPLFCGTLEILAQMNLKKLNIKNCLKQIGGFFENIWIENSGFVPLEEADVDTKVLWAEDEGLRKSLKYLDVSLNEIDSTNMKEILRMDLIELNVSETSEKCSEDFSNWWQNSIKTLKILRIRGIEIDFNILTNLFEINLEIFEFSYDAVKNFNDFSQLQESPMMETLKELTIDLKNHCQQFIHLLSKMKLSYFECKLGTWYYYNFDVFWNSSNRTYLKTLILEDGKISETDAEGISKLKLDTLSLSPFLFDSKEHILEILASDNVRYSVTDIRIGGAYEVDSDHLNLLIKFRNLRKLSLKISGTNLTRVFSRRIEHFKNLNELKLKVYIGLNIDEEAASALCNLPINTDLTIALVGLGKKWSLTFSEKAHQVFRMQNFLYNSDYPVRLELSDCTLDFRCGQIFKNFNIDTLVLNSCVLKNFFDSFFDEKIIYSLQYLVMKRVDVDHKQLLLLRKLCLSELSVFTSLDYFEYNKLPIVLSDGAISNSLCILRLGTYSCVPYIEYIMRTKISVYGLFPTHLLRRYDSE